MNHDKILSFFMDFINNGLQMTLVALTGIILNLAFVFAMAKNSERTNNDQEEADDSA